MNAATGSNASIEVALDWVETPPDSVDLCAPLELVIAVEGREAQRIIGARYEVLDGGSLVADGVIESLGRRDPNEDAHDPRNGPLDTRPYFRIALSAPRAAGTCRWRLTVPRQSLGATDIAAASVDFEFTACAHRISVVAWDAPSPIAVGESFRLKAGVKCSACCNLAAASISLRNSAGEIVGRALLGDACWPDAEGLYWTEIESIGPANEGLHEFEVAFAPGDQPLPHQAGAKSFSLVATRRPEHHVRLALVDRDSGAPIAAAQVRLGFARAQTDADGVAEFHTPGGEQRLFIWKAGYELPEQQIEVVSDLELRLEGKAQPPKDPYARWTG